MQKLNILRKLTVLFSVFFLLTPTVKVPGFIGIRLDDLLAFLIIFLFFLLSKSATISVKVPVRAGLILIFSLLLLISISWGATYGLPTSILDLTKYIWLAKLFVIYLVFYNYIYFDTTVDNVIERRNAALSSIVTIASVSALICMSQFFNPLNINNYYVPFVAPTQFTTLIEGYGTPRVVGMIGNPNAQGYLMALTLLSGLYLMLTNASRLLGIKLLLIFIAMIMTLSRSSLAVFVIGALFLFFFYKKDKMFSYYKYLVLTLMGIFLFGAFVFLKENEVIYNLILWRFEGLANIMDDKSFITRFHGWIINIEYFTLSPVFGVGPLPRGGEVFGASDNEWLFFLRSYGAVGTFWLFFFLFFSFLLNNSLKVSSIRNFNYFSLSVVIMTSIYMIPAGVITSSSLSSLFVAILAFNDKQIFAFTNK
ncbi:O-antigen ligase family protein [Pseudoalteromonas sp. SR45-4]|uniref:O-antigen ligase family protein n=1 Tax=Pseudoalteromonas sp. SR45-4 TaxID=2760929 RepID=UPI0015FE1CBE|nr:O-antigen ligase family protein [Pseudoalteromonas sp. SR45-4]MBB1369935.1 O-antigen ligase family protein [Pseudoalteromonas sp. SR45-4]